MKRLERAVKNMMNRWNKMALAVPYATWCEHVFSVCKSQLVEQLEVRQFHESARRSLANELEASHSAIGQGRAAPAAALLFSSSLELICAPMFEVENVHFVIHH
jgi:hypothetical protein